MSAPGKPTASGLYAAPVVMPGRPRAGEPRASGLRSVVMRLPREANAALDALAKDTRVRKSEYLREAIADLLSKHAEKVDGAP